MQNKKAIVTGVNGMDGSYMCDLLRSKGYDVIGINRDSRNGENQQSYIRKVISEHRPDEFYNFAGYSNTFDPYSHVDDIFDLNLNLPIYILNAIYDLSPLTKLFQASSCLIFGNKTGAQNEQSQHDPIYPYGIAKLAAQNMVKIYRTDRKLFCCSGILFPHESERRGVNFFTKKVASSAAKISVGAMDKLELGDLSQMRDWTYAPDICKAAHLMLQDDVAADYVIGTGIPTSLEEFVIMCFEYVKLDYRDHVVMCESLVRPNDMNAMLADPSKIVTELGWTPHHNVRQIVSKMMEYELKSLR